MTPTLTQTPSGWSFTLPHITANGYPSEASAFKAAQAEIAFMNFEGETIEDQLERLGL